MDYTTWISGEDKIEPLTNNPHFTCILPKSSAAKSPYQLVVPAKFRALLPQIDIPVVLFCQNKSWEMVYFGGRSFKRFDHGWKRFAIENNLKTGDGCVFELMNSKDVLQFKVQILRGRLPFDGKTIATPIVIE